MRAKPAPEEDQERGLTAPQPLFCARHDECKCMCMYYCSILLVGKVRLRMSAHFQMRETGEGKQVHCCEFIIRRLYPSYFFFFFFWMEYFHL